MLSNLLVVCTLLLPSLIRADATLDGGVEGYKIIDTSIPPTLLGRADSLIYGGNESKLGSPPANGTQDVDMSPSMDEELHSGSLFVRQTQCSAGYVYTCGGSRPCCQVGYTVCCTGGCCPSGHNCPAAGSTKCCPNGSGWCASAGVCCPLGTSCPAAGSNRCCPSGSGWCSAAGVCCPSGYNCPPAGSTRCCPSGSGWCASAGVCCRSGYNCPAPGSTVCCPSGSGWCSASGGCCPSGTNCPAAGSTTCCRTGTSACGEGCCASGTTCCGGAHCCVAGSQCQSGQCVYPATSTRATVNSNPNPTTSSSGNDLETNFELKPDDPSITYDPSDAWNNSGGTCNGTKSTTTVGAKITFSFYGNKLSFQTVPTADGVKYTVTLNGLAAEAHDTNPALASGCQYNETWTRSLTSQQHEVTFTYMGVKIPSSKRAVTGLEFAGLKYNGRSLSSSSSSSPTSTPGGTSDGSRPQATVIAFTLFSVLIATTMSL